MSMRRLSNQENYYLQETPWWEKKKIWWGGSLICAPEKRRRRRRVQELLYRPQESSRQVVWVEAHSQHLPTCLSLSGCRDYFRTVVTPAVSLLLKGGNSLLLCINHGDAVRHHTVGRGVSTSTVYHKGSPQSSDAFQCSNIVQIEEEKEEERRFFIPFHLNNAIVG